MSIRVALSHKTTYTYGQSITLGPQTVRLRPAPHCRTPICSYSLNVLGGKQFLNWQQDPYGNYLARIVFPEKVREFCVHVDLVADMTVVNPFDFFLEPEAELFPFVYEEPLHRELLPFLSFESSAASVLDFVESIDRTPRRTTDFLVALNQMLWKAIKYVIRMEPGVQTPEQTLLLGQGSCRDSSWLLVEVLRHLGLAARFTSGYLIQLKADEKPVEGPAGPTADFTDLHAWAEVYLPGAGWIGLDPTSGLFAGEGHLPLACSPRPASAAPISGYLEECETEFQVEMRIERVHEDPRVTLPYTEDVWERIQDLGHQVDQGLESSDVRLTMGGEPTFVSTEDMESSEWQTEAVGPTKQRFANTLIRQLKERFAPGALLHCGQGKWYPGESLPRWSFRCYWRTDGEPIWREPALIADTGRDYGCSPDDANRFCRSLAVRLGVQPQHVMQAYEDVLYYMWRERCLPSNVDPHDNRLDDPVERARVTRVFERGLTRPVGSVLPVRFQWWNPAGGWQSGWWHVRSDELFLIPGDSPIGLRLPTKSLTWLSKQDYPTDFFPRDPFDEVRSLPGYAAIRNGSLGSHHQQSVDVPLGGSLQSSSSLTMRQFAGSRAVMGLGDTNFPFQSKQDATDETWSTPVAINGADDSNQVVPTAICVEARGGCLHVFLPPVDRVEQFLQLISAIEETAECVQVPIAIEGYLPPYDSRLQHFSVTPDPGVIEVNVQPAKNWRELTHITETVYSVAKTCRLGAEKFDRDGTHTGTGGGNHIVLGGPRPCDSPFLRRPDLLRSLISYWHNHPSLSYLFSGRFVGPTSQAPRIDEGRRDARYELSVALDQIPDPDQSCPPWLVDRILRHLLVDGTGNTHRAEFCIDKLFSPDSAAGRLGLLELRAFEMPPHPRMCLTQQLLLRTLVARFWKTPYKSQLVDWSTGLHDRYMLPHFVWQDFCDVVQETRDAGYPLDSTWFEPHLEFRFPKIGQFVHQSVCVELRTAIEPWYVLGEESTGAQTARYVDSSVERMQVRVNAMTDPRYFVACNGRRVPLHPTGREGEYVAGIRYRAWQPPHCLHPLIPVDTPLVFDLVDTWMRRSLGGGQYHVGHPGGLNPAAYPVNAFEAESRRAARFRTTGHTSDGGPWRHDPPSTDFPLTLDLRLR
ncbi:MAG: transglutaminase family protein [Planctomycetota bacterium]|nr:transglutaminase family protein [Planctomycetota bacterium]